MLHHRLCGAWFGIVFYNLDPFGECSDEEIWNALRLASLDEFVKSMDDGLDSIVAERLFIHQSSIIHFHSHSLCVFDDKQMVRI